MVFFTSLLVLVLPHCVRPAPFFLRMISVGVVSITFSDSAIRANGVRLAANGSLKLRSSRLFDSWEFHATLQRTEKTTLHHRICCNVEALLV